MTIFDIISDLWDAHKKYPDATQFEYKGFRWRYDGSFHPDGILHRAVCPDDRRAAQYDHPIPYYPELKNMCICESLL